MRKVAFVLSLVLIFVALKMLAMEFIKIPVAWSLAVIALLVGGSMLASQIFPKRPSPQDPGPAEGATP